MSEYSLLLWEVTEQHARYTFRLIKLHVLERAIRHAVYVLFGLVENLIGEGKEVVERQDGHVSLLRLEMLLILNCSFEQLASVLEDLEARHLIAFSDPTDGRERTW